MSNDELLGKLKEFLSYDQETGIFTRIKLSPRSRKNLIGMPAGSGIGGGGYVSIDVDGMHFLAHRLAWLFVNGIFPTVVDHINRVKSDNRICNLREASFSENSQNRAILNPRNLLGIPGVSKSRKKYKAQISIGKGVQISLGLFNTPEEAAKVYMAKKMEIHPAAFTGMLSKDQQ